MRLAAGKSTRKTRIAFFVRKAPDDKCRNWFPGENPPADFVGRAGKRPHSVDILRYKPLPILTRQQVEEWLSSGVADKACIALLSAAFYNQDPSWTEEQCLRSLDATDKSIQASAALGLAHIARLNGKLDLTRVMPILERLLTDPELSGQVQDALDDIEVFIMRRAQE